MRKDFGPKAWVFPQPVLIVGTYDDGVPNAMNAAWVGQYSKTQVILSLGDHKTTDNIRKNQAFTIGLATTETLIGADYVGLVSGNDVPNKVEKAGFTASRSYNVNAPVFGEFPLTLECKLVKFNEDGNVIGEIVNAAVDDSLVNAEGEIDVSGLHAVVYDPINADYYKVGEQVGHAFRDGEKLK